MIAAAVPDLLQLVGAVFALAGGAGALCASGWIAMRRTARLRRAGMAIAISLALTGIWCLALATPIAGTMGATLLEALGNIGWLLVVYRLFEGDGRDTSLSPIRPLMLVLVLVEILQLAFVGTISLIPLPEQGLAIVFRFTTVFRLLEAIGGLVLVHNLYTGASAHARRFLRWPALGLGILWVFDLNLYMLGYLNERLPTELTMMRGIAVLGLAVAMSLGTVKGRDELVFRPSRAVAFRSISLVVIAAYLAGMVAVAQWLAWFGGDFARLMSIGFIAATSTFALLILPSRRVRGWIKVKLAKHLFRHRYDYRDEWLRLTNTIGKAGGEASPLEERIIQAIADISDSPAGLLLAPGEQGDLVLAARWQWQSAEVPAVALPQSAAVVFERTGFIADIDDMRAGRASQIDAAMPEWLLEEPRAWALVPLIHYERLVGVVVLARPPYARKFDWEDLDLLRIAGQQLASYLAEDASQSALAEAGRFDDFNRRMAFVMHDIKNLASQLSLLARNAEIHADKPAFRADMLVTLRNSSDKLNTLLARLSRYGSGSVERLEEVDATALLRQVVDQFRPVHPIMLAECHDCVVRANRDSLEQVLLHLVQNAVDASEANSPILLGITGDGLNASIAVVDSGCGMSPEFIRAKLFKPFVSSKQGGFGIGAFEARELVRAMKGRLEVESREGLGSRFVVRLPLAAASGIFDTYEISSQKVA